MRDGRNFKTENVCKETSNTSDNCCMTSRGIIRIIRVTEKQENKLGKDPILKKIID